jgi:hypothetical protein
MASTYSSSLRIQLIETGTENEAWGQPLDNNLGTVIEQAIVGSNTISLTNLTSYTLTTANASPDQARNAVLIFDGALTANCNVIAPSVKKVYVVSNKTSGGYFVNIKTSSGNAVSVINGTNQLVYCDGTDFKTAVNINNIIGNLAVSGNASVNGSVVIGGNISGPNNLTSTSGNITTTSNSSIVKLSNNNGASILPTGNTAQRPTTLKLGMQRWNTELGWMEIWNGLIWYPLTGTYGVQYVVVAGGGGGGFESFQGSGGGGAGGVLIGGTTVQASTPYTVTIGGGAAVNAKGSNTFALGFTALGGGAGAGNSNTGIINGGSGGGRCTRDNPAENFGPGSGTTGQGFAGSSTIAQYIGGGGGGAGQIGQGLNGGNGASSSITGTLAYYGGGGGGGNRQVGNGGSGGLGGGGFNNTAGTANTGGGGAGGGSDPGAFTGSAGGSGVTIISYASPVQRGSGGNVTSYSSGGTTYWVHTFTTSGTFTA